MQRQYGRTLIECKSAPLGSALGFLISLIFVISLFFGRKLGSVSITADLLGWGLFLLLSLLMLYCLRLMIKPLRMVVVTDNGIVFYYHANAWLREPVFIPWQNISELNLVKREKTSSEGRKYKVDRIEAKIINYSKLSIPDRMFNHNSATIDIDDNPMTPCGRKLLLAIDSLPESKHFNKT